MIRFVNVVAFGAQLDEGLYNSDSRTALNKQNFVGGGGSYGKALELACHANRINVVVAQWPNWHFRSIFHTVSHWGKKPNFLTASKRLALAVLQVAVIVVVVVVVVTL